MKKVLVFTVIDYPDNSFDGIENGELTSELKESIAEEFDFNKEELAHESFYCSEAMNGQELYAEIVSDNQEALNEIVASIQKANPKTRDDVEKWVEDNQFTLIETEGSLGLWDEFFIEVK